jgi:hypothetical protein
LSGYSDAAMTTAPGLADVSMRPARLDDLNAADAFEIGQERADYLDSFATRRRSPRLPRSDHACAPEAAEKNDRRCHDPVEGRRQRLSRSVAGLASVALRQCSSRSSADLSPNADRQSWIANTAIGSRPGRLSRCPSSMCFGTTGWFNYRIKKVLSTSQRRQNT